MRRSSEYGRRDWGNGRNQQLGARADRIAQRARELYRSGRLSADHRDRTIEKLQRVRSDARDRNRESRNRVQANDRYLDQVERTLNEWAAADSRGNRIRPRR